jgi:multidrug transporter EmrE-like cation transporter
MSSSSSSLQLFDAAVLTIFAREFLEGTIIIGEFRTIILCGQSLEDGLTKQAALRAIAVAAIWAALLALVAIAAVAIPLVVLSKSFDPSTSKVIEGISKIVAGICLLQLSLKLPKWLGVYGSLHAKTDDDESEENDEDHKEESREDDAVDVEQVAQEQDDCNEDDTSDQNNDKSLEQSLDINDDQTSNNDDKKNCLTLKSIRFNVAWNIWREVAECGIFLIPSFLSGEGLTAIPFECCHWVNSWDSAGSAHLLCQSSVKEATSSIGSLCGVVG